MTFLGITSPPDHIAELDEDGRGGGAEAAAPRSVETRSALTGAGMETVLDESYAL
jgi:hypothetical protein